MLFRCKLYGELRLPGVMERRNGPSGLRDGDDDDDKKLKLKFFPNHKGP